MLAALFGVKARCCFTYFHCLAASWQLVMQDATDFGLTLILKMLRTEPLESHGGRFLTTSLETIRDELFKVKMAREVHQHSIPRQIIVHGHRKCDVCRLAVQGAVILGILDSDSILGGQSCGHAQRVIPVTVSAQWTKHKCRTWCCFEQLTAFD